MNVLFFSAPGIYYEDGGKGDVTAIYLPSKVREQRFTDLQNPNEQAVKLRYGDVHDPAPLWRTVGPYVYAYGSMLPEIVERRNAHKVYLPQDFVKPGTSAFYYVLGNRWVVHGVKTISEDGQETWGCSRIDGDDMGIVRGIVSSVSEHMLAGSDESIVVAVHANDAIKEDLQKALDPFGVEVINFDKLKPARAVKPLYIHRDYGLLMLILTIISFLTLIMTLIYLALGYFNLEQLKDDVAKKSDEIRIMKKSIKLGHIKDPDKILEFMQPPLKQLPSSVLHSAAEVGALFGEINNVSLGETGKRGSKKSRRRGARKKNLTVNVNVNVQEQQETLLVNQEHIASAALETRPWVRSIRRNPGKSGTNLVVELQVLEK